MVSRGSGGDVVTGLNGGEGSGHDSTTPPLAKASSHMLVVHFGGARGSHHTPRGCLLYIMHRTWSRPALHVLEDLLCSAPQRAHYC